MFSIENLLIIISLLFAISLVANKTSSRIGIPSLLLFLFIGMLAGPEGLGRARIDNPFIAQAIGVIALIFILFSGGFETDLKSVSSILKEGIALSTAGVLLTAILLGVFATAVLHFTLLEGLLLGAIVSSTDAAAVFAILRSKKVSLKDNLQPLLEFESGSNDPMAFFLTIGLISIINNRGMTLANLVPLFFFQMGVGAVTGYLIGMSTVYLLKKVKFEYEGLYPVLVLSMILFLYAFTAICRGNGFLAVYVAGVLIGNYNIKNRKILIHFYNGLAWIMQIVMFLTLGLLILPSKIVPIIGTGLLVSVFLMFVARPLSVFATLFFSRTMDFREKLFVSWVGLRGSLPIILATFPLIAGVNKADVIFNLVFFIVFTSTLLQGTSVTFVSKLLKLDAPYKRKSHYPLELEYTDRVNTRLLDFIVPYNSVLTGKSIAELDLPEDSLVTLIVREEDFVVPAGKTTIEPGDVLLILVNDNNLEKVKEILFSPKP